MEDSVDAAGGGFEPPRRIQMKFLAENCCGGGMEEGTTSGSVELSLGLSLNGRFGVDPAAKNRGRKSRHYDADVGRCSSVEEECGRRKERISVRKVVEKRKGSGKRRRVEEVEDEKVRSCKDQQTGGEGFLESDSLGIVDSENDPLQGLEKNYYSSSRTERRKKRQHERWPILRGGEGAEMPSVSARGDGPNGKRVEGFLCKYGKGEEVRIVCVCHGIFLSPSQFLQHAGCLEVDHPLRHIVVRTESHLPFSVNGTKNMIVSSDTCY